MGEVEDLQELRLSTAMQENIINRWFFPDRIERMRALEDRLFEHTQYLGLQLQRAQSQNRQLLNEDVGQYRNRWANLAMGDYNPDTISFDEYKKMATYDSQVIAGWDLIKMGVLMKPWRIRHKDEKIVKELTNTFKDMRYPSFRDAMKQMLDAVLYGFSVTEVVFEDYRGNWYPRKTNGLKTFDPDTIRFYSDAYGNLLNIQQYGYISDTTPVSSYSLGTGKTLPLERTLIWTHEKQWGNWYGNPLLKGCYKNWYIKDAMLKFANIAYERFGSPILKGIARNPNDMLTISEAIEHLYARSQAVIVRRDDKDPTDVEVLESRRKEMPFDRYIRYHDEMILRRMLIGQRIFEGGGGVYGPKVPLDIIFMRFEDFRLELIDTINDLLRIIVDLNWPVEEYPRLEFAPLTTLDQQQLRQSIYEAIDRGVIVKDEPWVRDELGFPPYQEPTKRLPEPVGPRPPPAKIPESTEAQALDALIEDEYRKWKYGDRVIGEAEEEEDWF